MATFEPRQIQLMTTGGPMPVLALVSGVWAVHPETGQSTYGDGTTERWSTEHYVVTHVPSGVAIWNKALSWVDALHIATRLVDVASDWCADLTLGQGVATARPTPEMRSLTMQEANPWSELHSRFETSEDVIDRRIMSTLRRAGEA